MKLGTEIIRLELKETFTISRGSEDCVETVIVSLEEGGVTGLGEASPSHFYGHTAKSVRDAIEEAVPAIERADPFLYPHLREFLDSPEGRETAADVVDDLLKHGAAILDRFDPTQLLQVLDGNRAALCAVDLALHDWFGKRFGRPLYQILNLDPARTPPSSFTIGISSIERMREKVREAADFPVLKVKLGTDRDLEIMRALREVSDAVFRVDANCAWDVEETIAKSDELADLGVEFIEQPLPPERLDDMKRVFEKSALPIIADESSVVPEDVAGLSGRFHGINIKLVKCGGIQPALEMIRIARAHDLKVMIGCMIESSVCISAGAHLGPLVDHLDLDGSILIGNDPYRGVENRKGTLQFPERGGLGVQRR